MTLSDTLKKVGNSIISVAKQKAVDTIANEKARSKAQKIVWKDMSTESRARNIESYGEFAPAIIWVTVYGVYATDKYRAGIVEITGEEAEKFRAESVGAAIITKTHRAGFGSMSHMDMQIPDYLMGARASEPDPKHSKKAQTYEEWMGAK